MGSSNGFVIDSPSTCPPRAGPSWLCLWNPCSSASTDRHVPQPISEFGVLPSHFWLRQDFFGDFGSSGGKTSPDTETASMAACPAPLAPLAEEGDGDLAAFLQVETLPWRWSVDSNLKMCVRCSIHLTICSVLSTNTLKEHFIVRRFATLSFCHVLVRYSYGGDRYINDIFLYF